MLTRIITAVVALAVFVPILIFGNDIVISIVFALICGVGVYEMLGCCGTRKNLFVSVPSVILCMFAVVIPLFKNHDLFGNYDVNALLVACLMLVYFMLLAVTMHKKLDVERLMMTFAVLFYVTAGFYSLASMQYMKVGLMGAVLVLAVSWCTDTFAYFTGMAFGKKKLCPEISPKKTVAGAIGGTLFGTVAGVLTMYFAFNKPLVGLIGLPLSIVSQFGDLAASVIKRKFGVKDYGKIFPGHGGILDRFDSIIPVAIITALIFNMFEIV